MYMASTHCGLPNGLTGLTFYQTLSSKYCTNISSFLTLISPHPSCFGLTGDFRQPLNVRLTGDLMAPFYV